MSDRKKLRELKAVGFLGMAGPSDDKEATNHVWVIRQKDWWRIIGLELGGFYPSQEVADKAKIFHLDHQDLIFYFIVPHNEFEYRVYKRAVALVQKVPYKYLVNTAARNHLFQTFISLFRGELDVPVKININNQYEDDVPF